jgi:hypothetical protein
MADLCRTTPCFEISEGSAARFIIRPSCERPIDPVHARSANSKENSSRVRQNSDQDHAMSIAPPIGDRYLAETHDLADSVTTLARCVEDGLRYRGTGHPPVQKAILMIEERCRFHSATASLTTVTPTRFPSPSNSSCSRVAVNRCLPPVHRTESVSTACTRSATASHTGRGRGASAFRPGAACSRYRRTVTRASPNSGATAR